MNTRRWFLRLLAGMPLLAVLPGPKPGKTPCSSCGWRPGLESPFNKPGMWRWHAEPREGWRSKQLKEMRCRHVIVSNWELD